MCFNMCAWCRYTRGRFDSTHGGRFVHAHGGARGHRLFCLPKFAHVWLSRDSEVHQRNQCIFTIFRLRISREQHVADSSNHSLSLIKLFSFSCLEGNKLLDCSVGLSPFSPSITNDVNVSIATSTHQRLPLSGRVHHLSSPDTLCLTRTTFKITEYIHILVHLKKSIYIFVYVHVYPFKKYLYIYVSS